MSQAKMEKLLSECRKHIMHLNSASTKMRHFMPLDENKYKNLTEDEVEHIDQFLFRFAKLQDTIGEKLFVELLVFLQEEGIKNKPFLDILNRLEQLGVLSDKDIWISLRKIRNDISHHYEEDSKDMALGINAIYLRKEDLLDMFIGVDQLYQKNIRPDSFVSEN
jgi:hypothetical protein